MSPFIKAACLASAIAILPACASVAEHHSMTKEVEQNDIVDTAIAAGSFTTLVAAVQAAGLEETLRSDGPFTVFAPTDAAFAKLPEGTVESLLLPENKAKLVDILTYHVLPSAVASGDIAGKTLDVETVQGTTVSVDATNGVMIDNATVVQADIDASNGIIHVIDTVLMP
ncbi:fasciclin domain-containing protein [Hyphococcus formosus]|uniref:fasciclin domain-containing protein n=1 Tax=Hyphococcus formosus TaxID=3143534 RepID=UPI00398BA0D5